MWLVRLITSILLLFHRRLRRRRQQVQYFVLMTDIPYRSRDSGTNAKSWVRVAQKKLEKKTEEKRKLTSLLWKYGKQCTDPDKLMRSNLLPEHFRLLVKPVILTSTIWLMDYSYFNYIYIYISVFWYVSIHVSLFLSIYLRFFLTINLSVYQFEFVHIYQVCLLSIYLSIPVCSHLSFYQSIVFSQFISKFVHVYLSIYLSQFVHVYLSIYQS